MTAGEHESSEQTGEARNRTEDPATETAAAEAFDSDADEGERDEFESDEDVSPDIEAFEGEEEDDDEDVDAVVELSGREQNARSLEIRRAIEERREKKRLQEDLDYLDFDDD